MKSEGPEERFIEFLRLFESESGELKYRTRLGQMAASSQKSLIVDFEDLIAFDEPLARDLVERPDEMFEYTNRAVWSQMKVEDPEYAENVKRFFARFKDLPERFPLRKICSDHVGKLLGIDGIIVRSTPVKPLLIRATFQCRQCSAITFVDQTGSTMRGPGICPECKGQKTKGKLFDLVEKQSLFIDSQEIRIQERPEELPPGQLPRYMNGKLTDDLVDRARPGDRVTLTGTIRALQELAARRGRLRTFELLVDSNHVDVIGREDDLLEITAEEERQIKEIARDPWSGNKMIRSLAPSIYGYEDIKESILYLLVGGTRKVLPDGVVIRGELNVLLIGDPGIAKCVTGDTNVLLADGALRPLHEVVSEAESSGRVFEVDDGICAESNHDLYSLGRSGNVVRTKGIRFWRRTAPDHLVRIATNSGKTITVTSTHPLFVLKNGRVVGREASRVGPGDFIATPRAVPFEGRPQPLSHIEYRLSRARNRVTLRLPNRTSPSFWRPIGLFVGEGYIQFAREGSATSFFTNSDERLLSEFAQFARKLGFRPKLRRPHSGKSSREVVIPGVEFASFLASIGAGGPSNKKRVPPLLFRCSRNEIAAFLSGLFDADGSVSNKQPTITLTSASRTLLEEVRHLLIRLGILCQLHSTKSRATNWPKSRTYYRLFISGEAAWRFGSAVGFDVKQKSKRVFLQKKRFNTNHDVVPELSSVLKRVRQALGLRQRDLGVPRGSYLHYELGDRNPSRRALRQVVDSLRSKGSSSTPSSIRADIACLEQLAYSDIFWDRVDRTKPVRPKEPYVYDVEVPGVHNFIAGDVFVHNSQLLQYAARVAPRGVYTAGRGSTAAGLTAAVLREKSGGMVLEAGALVLADKGVCCMTPEDEIFTVYGLQRVEDLWNHAKPLKTFGQVERRSIFLPIQTFADRGFRRRRQPKDAKHFATTIMRRPYSGEVVELTFRSGMKLRLTPDHLVRSNRSYKRLWVPACQLKPGDLLKFPTKLAEPESTLILPIEAQTAYLLGCVYGDGYVTPQSITIAQSRNNDDIIRNIQTLAPPYHFSEYRSPDKLKEIGKYVLIEKLSRLWTSDKQLIELYETTIGRNIDSLLQFDNAAIRAFFAGLLDTDGNLHYSHGELTMIRISPTAKEHHLAVLLHCLLRIDVRGIFRKSRHNPNVHTIEITGRNISIFLDAVKEFSAKARRARFVSIRHKRTRLEPNEEMVVEVSKAQYSGFVYDLYVSSHHNFLAGGIYIHNCIDEIEKMRDEDRVAIHEALEQNTVSVAKGGIVATLNARTSVLAAANPALGRYDPYQTVTENITLPVTLLSRFDLIFVMRDMPEPERDAKISQHILTLHRDKSSGESPPISPEILKKYISYTKRINPVISDEAMKELKEFYLKMRSASGSNESPVSITPRQLEALIRLAEARSRVSLKETVTVEDARQAIRLMNVCLENVGIDTRTGKVDIDVIMTGKPRSLRERMQILLSKIAEIEKKSGFVAESDLYEALAKEKLMEEGEAKGVVSQLIREGLIYSPKPGTLRRTAV